MEQPGTRSTTPLTAAIVAAGSLVAMLGAAVLVGWLTGLTRLVQVVPGFVPMQFNTALAMLCCGIGVVAAARRAGRTAATAGVIAGGLGLLTLAEYAFAVDLGIDQFFGAYSLSDGTSHSGRMAPNTAVCFALVGLVLAGHLSTGRRRRRVAARPALAAVAVALATVALVGYIAGIETAYGWGELTRMALQTSLAFVVLGAALIALEWSPASRRIGGPPWLPAIVAVGCATVAICLGQALAERDLRQLERSVDRTAAAVRRGVERRLELQLNELRQLGDRWAMRDGMSREEWELDARYFARVEPGLSAIEWVETGGGSQPERLREAASTAHIAGRARFTPSFVGAGERRSFLLAVPLISGGLARGTIVGVYQIDPLLRAVARDLELAGVGLALHEGDHELFRGGESSERNRLRHARETEISLGHVAWRLELWPSDALVAAEASILPQVSVVVGLLVAILLGLTIRATQRALGSLRGLEAANRNLGHEIAERRRAEAELRALNATLEARVAAATAESECRAAELEASNSDLEQFAYVASHDLQEPLRAVSGFCQLLERRYRGALGAQADEYLDEILGGTERMQRMIRDLLAYSRVGRRTVEALAVDCDRVIDEACAALGAAIVESGVRITCHPLPTVHSDRAQLEQLLRNLIGNSIKYRGDTEPSVTVDARRDGAEWILAVTDNGIGIDPRHHARIFDVFQRLHTRDEYPGTGIGLAICKRIVERLGGRIWVESGPGRGTTVRFTLPATGDDPDPETGPVRELGAPARSATTGTRA